MHQLLEICHGEIINTSDTMNYIFIDSNIYIPLKSYIKCNTPFIDNRNIKSTRTVTYWMIYKYIGQLYKVHFGSV